MNLLQNLCFNLSRKAINAGYCVSSFSCVRSTNSLGENFAKNGDLGKLWIVSNKQTKGRARRGGFWISDSGNLYITLLLIGNFNLQEVYIINFISGIFVVEALNKLNSMNISSNYCFNLKWPNDILVNDAKLAGILIEYIALGPQRNGILIGIGINVKKTPLGEFSYKTTSLKELGYLSSSQDVFYKLSEIWIFYDSLWKNSSNINFIKKLWMKYSIGIGEKIFVKINGKKIFGIFEDIDNNFRIILRKENNRKIVISSGDIFFQNH